MIEQVFPRRLSLLSFSLDIERRGRVTKTQTARCPVVDTEFTVRPGKIAGYCSGIMMCISLQIITLLPSVLDLKRKSSAANNGHVCVVREFRKHVFFFVAVTYVVGYIAWI